MSLWCLFNSILGKLIWKERLNYQKREMKKNKTGKIFEFH